MAGCFKGARRPESEFKLFTFNPTTQPSVNSGDFADLLTSILTPTPPREMAALQVQAFRQMLIGHFSADQSRVELLRLALVVIDHTVRSFAPLAMDEAEAYSVAIMLRALPRLTNAEGVRHAERECDVLRTKLTDLVDTGEIDDKEFEVADGVMQHTALACSLFGDFSPELSLNEYRELMSMFLACVVEAHQASVNLAWSSVSADRFWVYRYELDNLLAGGVK